MRFSVHVTGSSGCARPFCPWLAVDLPKMSSWSNVPAAPQPHTCRSRPDPAHRRPIPDRLTKHPRALSLLITLGASRLDLHIQAVRDVPCPTLRHVQVRSRLSASWSGPSGPSARATSYRSPQRACYRCAAGRESGPPALSPWPRPGPTASGSSDVDSSRPSHPRRPDPTPPVRRTAQQQDGSPPEHNYQPTNYLRHSTRSPFGRVRWYQRQ